MNRTLPDLRVQLGEPVRFSIDADGRRRKRPVITTVHWSCGCSAGGPGLSALAAVHCALHARPSGGRVQRGVSLLRGLLGGPNGRTI